MQNINKICRKRAQNHIDLKIQGQLQPGMGSSRATLTPSPLINKQTKFKTNPTVPSTYVVTIPEAKADSGKIVSAGSTAARRRSSGYHDPLFALYWVTMRSDSRPASGAPTVTATLDYYCPGDREGRRRTHAANPVRDETGPYEYFVGQVVLPSLNRCR
jgi:hypothetical protein